ncbi:MAG TPA: hypothetical protein VIW01_01905 [Dehalococcoidia bacterium]
MSGYEATYEIRVKGHLGARFARLFDGFELTTDFQPDGKPVSILSGSITDQSALHGTLTKIRDLGMEIVSVNQVEEGTGR